MRIEKQRDGYPTGVHCWSWILIVGVWFCLFWSVNRGETVIGYRDSAYFYYPYFRWIDEVWKSGQIPLWNPYCDLGYPVVGDGSSSVFYPGKSIFCWRSVRYSTRYGWYLSLHVLLAAWGACWLSRSVGANVTGATWAGLAYGLSGSVLFQTTNIIYLVGAAWLPWGMYFVRRMYRRGGAIDVVGASGVCAMMVLGGDPQMAYMCGLVAIVLLVIKAIGGRRKPHLTGWLVSRGAIRLVGLATGIGVLAAVQVLPTYLWTQHSTRNVVRGTESTDQTSLQPASERSTAGYEFSQPPWTMLELVWPNVSGKPFPINERWTDALPGADRVWTPSLYCGLLTFVMGIGSMRFWGRMRVRVWLTWTAILFAVGSFGWYGAVWLYNEITLGLGGWPHHQLAPHVGGVYWCFEQVLPQFHLFRYPAKLFVVACLAICVLAGLGFDSKGLRYKWLQRGLVTLTLVSIVGWLAVRIFEFPNYPSIDDPLFGPMEASAANRVISQSVLHTAVVSAILAAFVWLGTRLETRSRNSLAILRIGVLVLSTAELIVANYWLLPKLDCHLLEGPTGVERSWLDNEGSHKRLIRDHKIPAEWANQRSDQRVSQIVAWQRETIFPKSHLTFPLGMVGSFTSIEHPANREFAEICRRDLVVRRWATDGTIRYDEFEQRGHIDWNREQSKRVWIIPVSQLSEPVNLKNVVELSNESCSDWDFEHWSNQKCVLNITTDQPSIVLYNSLAYTGWRVAVDAENENLALPNREVDSGPYFLGTVVPAGRSQVVFEYRPWDVWLGAAISAVGWGAIGFYGFCCGYRRFRRFGGKLAGG